MSAEWKAQAQVTSESMMMMMTAALVELWVPVSSDLSLASQSARLSVSALERCWDQQSSAHWLDVLAKAWVAEWLA